MATGASSVPEATSSAAERFFRYFQHEVTALQDQMARLGDTALVGGERKDATDHCLAGITRLSSEVKDASASLPSYDLRTYTEAIKALQEKLAETQAQFAPKQKFSFKTKKNLSAVSIHDAAELAAQKQKSSFSFNTASGASSFATTPVHLMTPPNELNRSQQTSTDQPSQREPAAGSTQAQPGASTSPSTSHDVSRPGLNTTATSTSVTTQTDAHIVLPASTTRAHTACTLSNLQSCCVDLSVPTVETAPFASLVINNVDSSLLLCGSVGGPAHITNIKNTTIMISCRQLRMHECENVDIYLYCTSRPIIEDCKEVRFAEMPPFYVDLLHSSHSNSNQAIGTNMWEQIDDFKWLRPERSPNWSVIPSEEQIPENSWKLLVPSKPGMSVNEILNIAHVSH